MPDPMSSQHDPSPATGAAQVPAAAREPCTEHRGQTSAVVVRRGGVDSALMDLRPRVQQPPTGLLDVVDRHLTSATTSDAVLGRYLTLLRTVRNAATIAIAIACALWAAGVYAAIRYGAPPWAADGLGLGGPAVVSCVGWVALRRSARRRV